MSKDERRELVALVSWLQTFDQFVYAVIDGSDKDSHDERFSLALESLKNPKITQAVLKVAEQVCEVENIDAGTNPTVDDIWMALLAVVSNKSRFQIDRSTTKLGTEADIAHCVLATLLDFAVSSPDLDSRRIYIERIMSLPKGVQKILMSLIERRKKSLPRKPKRSSFSSPFHKSKLSHRILCGAGGNLLLGQSGSSVRQALKPILKHGSKAKVNSKLAANNHQGTPPQQPDQMPEEISSPPRERPIPKVPQSEPRVTSNRDVSFPSFEPVQSERSHSGNGEESHPLPTVTKIGRRLSGSHIDHNPTHHVLPPHQFDPNNNNMQQLTNQQQFYPPVEQQPLPQECFVSPSRGTKGDQQTFASSGKHKAGGLDSPFRERFNPDLQSQQQPHPTFATFNNSNEQIMPVNAIPSDEFDDMMDKQCDKSEMSRAATSATADSGSEVSMASPDLERDSIKPPGSVITISKRSRDGFSSPSRTHSSVPPSTLKTPETALAMYEHDVEGRMMLSPAESMLQSPMQVEDFVKELRAKNKNLESVLVSYQKRERELSQKMESTETKLRKEMMKLESRALGREDELRQNYENEVAKLKKDLRAEKEKNKDSKKAQEELAMANDELELMQHTQAKLQEATEKLRKYKDRLDAMNDFKEALQREQEAHSKSVEECVRLENELNLLQPLKRQLEEYKARAIETEVQLAECKDELSRLERERNELDGARNDVLKEAQTQRAQADELRKFIKLEENGEAGPGIGEGISELNPELQEEIIKLRNENIKLRAFAEQRTDDSVQKLEENLEDSNQRQERFKEEFLKKKHALEETETLLGAARQKLASLEDDIRVKEHQAEEYEGRLSALESQYTECLEDLEGLQEQIDLSEQQKSDLEEEKANLLSDIEQQKAEYEQQTVELETHLAEQNEAYESHLAEQNEAYESHLAKQKTEYEAHLAKQKAEYEAHLADSKEKSAGFEAQLKMRTDDLETTKKELIETMDQKLQVENSLSEALGQIEKLDKTLDRRVDELVATRKELTDTEMMLADSEQREEELNHRVESLERKAKEIQDQVNNAQNELRDTQLTLKETQECLKQTEGRESRLKQDCIDLKHRCEKLTKQLKEEKKAKQLIIEENHKALEATREVLTSKANKDLEELQSNMNQLLEDERKAYRQKAEQATIDYNTLQMTYEKKLSNVKEQSERVLKVAKDDAEKQLYDLEQRAEQKYKTLQQQEKSRYQQLVEQGEQLVEELQRKAKAEFTLLYEENQQLKEDIFRAEEAKHELGAQFTKESNDWKKKMQFAGSQVREYEGMADDLKEFNKKLEREKRKLEEENDQFRRQLGGRPGANGTLQSHMEKLNKELMDSQKENRELKKKLASYASEDMSFSFDATDGDSNPQQEGCSNQGSNPSALAQVRQGYEAEIATLKDEMREHIMQSTAARTDVQKANQAVCEREEELEKMKNEIVSLKLALQRQNKVNALGDTAENDELNISAYSTRSNVSFSRDHEASSEQDQNRVVRPKLNVSVANTSSVTKEKVLTPSSKHENSKNVFSENKNSHELQVKDLKSVSIKTSSPRKTDRQPSSIVDVTQTTSSPVAQADDQPECIQS